MPGDQLPIRRMIANASDMDSARKNIQQNVVKQNVRPIDMIAEIGPTFRLGLPVTVIQILCMANASPCSNPHTI